MGEDTPAPLPRSADALFTALGTLGSALRKQAFALHNPFLAAAHRRACSFAPHRAPVKETFTRLASEHH